MLRNKSNKGKVLLLSYFSYFGFKKILAKMIDWGKEHPPPPSFPNFMKREKPRNVPHLSGSPYPRFCIHPRLILDRVGRLGLDLPLANKYDDISLDI